MRRFRYSLGWAGAAAGLFLGWWPAAAQPCPCPTFDLTGVVKEADMILVGRALSATTDSTGAKWNDEVNGWRSNVEFQTRLLFDVQTIIKGAPPRFVEVVTPTGPCGFPFAVGETYVVVGKSQGQWLATDACKGNVSGAEAIDARVTAIRNALHPPPAPPEPRERR
jgi:hypothetical protein